MRICNSLIIVKLSTPKLISASYLSFKSFYPYPSCIDYILFWLYNTSIDTVWKSTGSCNSSSIVTQMTVPFLPMNTEFSATRNQVIFIEYTMCITLLSLPLFIKSSIRNQVNIKYTSLLSLSISLCIKSSIRNCSILNTHLSLYLLHDYISSTVILWSHLYF